MSGEKNQAIEHLVLETGVIIDKGCDVIEVISNVCYNELHTA